MKTIRVSLFVFILLLLLSGITAFPIRTELAFLLVRMGGFPGPLSDWLFTVNTALWQTPELIFYGTDWLAFGHIVISLFFIPVIFDPVRYKANLTMAMIACVGVFPLAFVCGPIRGIPFFHQLIDCSFGFFGFILLFFTYQRITKLESLYKQS